jgi:hypothetical protein
MFDVHFPEVPALVNPGGVRGMITETGSVQVSGVKRD